MALLPVQKLGCAVMINTWAAPGLHGALVTRILDTYLELPERDWSGEALARYKSGLETEAGYRRSLEARRAQAAPADRPLADYAGVYEAPLWGAIEVRHEGETLTLHLGQGASAELAHWEHDTCLVNWTDPLQRELFIDTVAVFGAGADGKIVRLSMTLNRDKVEATRRPTP
jgi:hypothetical protein